ncbi:MAG: hypothetical protein O2975_00155 [Proteobacteria bacterium]|nr:hypothetical protein [Pseudomonadota bacterium]
MTFGSQDLRKLALPIALCALLLGGGAGLIWWMKAGLVRSGQALAAARAEGTQAREKLARIAEEEREVNQKLAVYRRLQALNVLGPERRLEWADSMKRIRTGREILDLSYRVDRQRQVASMPGKPASVDFFASRMKVDLGLLHEGDLLGFLRDLRESGNAFYAIQRCAMARTGVAATAPTLGPRLRADCEIDLITILDRAAKDPARRAP